jgi:TRAP-type mannitol/chloroaromatic compound transport system substrate-binding protein
MCYTSVEKALQKFYKSFTKVLQKCYKSVTKITKSYRSDKEKSSKIFDLCIGIELGITRMQSQRRAQHLVCAACIRATLRLCRDFPRTVTDIIITTEVLSVEASAAQDGARIIRTLQAGPKMDSSGYGVKKRVEKGIK